MYTHLHKMPFSGKEIILRRYLSDQAQEPTPRIGFINQVCLSDQDSFQPFPGLGPPDPGTRTCLTPVSTFGPRQQFWPGRASWLTKWPVCLPSGPIYLAARPVWRRGRSLPSTTHRPHPGNCQCKNVLTIFHWSALPSAERATDATNVGE